MPAPMDLTGKMFGRLLVLGRYDEKIWGARPWICECQCLEKKRIIVATSTLTTGNTSSCGCLRKEVTIARSTTHDLSRSREYAAWEAMKNRCYNPKYPKYKNYGGRGIAVCVEWINSFEAFYRDMGPKPTPEHSIDRKDNDKGYYKDNCRWATRLEQINNTSRNVYYEIDGQRKTLAEWCRIYDVGYKLAHCRIKELGMEPKRALTFVKIKASDKYAINDETKTLKEWCREKKVKFRTVASRLYNGWTLEEALTPIERKLVTLDGHSEFLEDWCAILDLDPETTYLRVIRGDDIDSIVNE